MKQQQLKKIQETINTLKTGIMNMKKELDTLEGLLLAPETTRELISAKEAMEMLHVSRPTLRQYAHDGQVVQVPLSSRRILFDKQSVENFIHRVGSWKC